MEILAEILLAILQFIGELLVQLLGQAFGELIGHGVRDVFRKPEPVSPLLATMGYALLGTTAGGLSLLVAPELYIKDHWLRAANLVLSPIAVGLLMVALGAWRRRHEREVIRLESFIYGAWFALSMAVVRAWWGQ